MTVQTCVFCRIVAGEEPASVAYEDEAILAFLDLRQFSRGHTLVMPKAHVPDIFALDEATGAALMRAVIQVARAVRAAIDREGMNLWQSNGEAAGQEVWHLHLHIVPRRRDDGLLRFYPSRPGYPARAELDRQAALIRAAV